MQHTYHINSFNWYNKKDEKRKIANYNYSSSLIPSSKLPRSNFRFNCVSSFLFIYRRGGLVMSDEKRSLKYACKIQTILIVVKRLWYWVLSYVFSYDDMSVSYFYRKILLILQILCFSIIAVVIILITFCYGLVMHGY